MDFYHNTAYCNQHRHRCKDQRSIGVPLEELSFNDLQATSPQGPANGVLAVCDHLEILIFMQLNCHILPCGELKHVVSLLVFQGESGIHS